MIRSNKIIAIFALLTGSLLAIVGDWTSYGSQLTLKDISFDNGLLKMASHGGLVAFDTDNEVFYSLNDGLEHIDLQSYYVNPDGSKWFSYASGVDGISYMTDSGNEDYFDFDFSEAKAFTGNSGHVLVAYMNDLTPEIAHFVKANNRYVFQDIYNQFPGSPTSINDIALVRDSLFLATDIGLIKGWLYHANLKPESAWERVLLDSVNEAGLLHAVGDSLYLVNQDFDLYRYYSGNEMKRLDGDKEGVAFCGSNEPYYASVNKIYRIGDNTVVYHSPYTISGFIVEQNILWVAEENRGLKKVSLTNELEQNFIPNTMLYTKANSLAISENNDVYVCGIEGVSVLKGSTWHDLVFSRGNESIENAFLENAFSSDTLDIAYRVGGETVVYDALITQSGELIANITHVSINDYTGQSPETQGPGAMIKIDLGNQEEYVVFDTSNGILDGTQGVGNGSSTYLMMHGLAEDRYGNIWALNAHTLAGETLLKFRPNGEVVKFSVEDSGDKLQILAREMVFDKYGRLWIANEARQSDEPRTTGGVTVYDPNTGVWALITTSDGLVNNNVYSIDIDPLTENIWVATSSGVQMIRTPSSFDETTDFSMNPAIDGLSGMVPVKIRIDPRGNKWILTQSQGIQIYMTNNRWFDEGNGLSTENSGLLDDVVFDLVFDTENGYAYLLTASGLNRYEIAWTEERSEMNKVIVFPQPFMPGVDPYIAFDGLADQSQVRISTLDGRVLIRFDADAEENLEKQLVWDGKLPNGDYIPRGVYLAFITNIDGLKSTVKFAVE